MKKLLLALFTLLLVAGCASTEPVDLSTTAPNTSNSPVVSSDKLEDIINRGKLVVATSPDYAPMEFIDTSKTGQDQYVGSDIELAKYIANELGVELEIKAMDFGLILSSVDLGQVDMGIAGLGYEPEREANFEMSIGYNQEGESGCQGLMVKTSEYDKYNSLEDFSDKKIIAQSGSLQESYVKEQLPDAQLQLVNSLDLALMSLMSDKADAFACSCDQMMAYEKNYDEIKMSSVEFDTSKDSIYDGNVIVVQKGQEALINKVNEILTEVNESGIYNQWNKEAKALASSLGLEFEE